MGGIYYAASECVALIDNVWEAGKLGKHVGNEDWPVWSDPIDKLLLLKLLKKFMLVLIERCQNTQGVTVCWVWGCIATDQSGCSMPQIMSHLLEYLGKIIPLSGTDHIIDHIDQSSFSLLKRTRSGKER